MTIIAKNEFVPLGVPEAMRERDIHEKPLEESTRMRNTIDPLPLKGASADKVLYRMR
jgi:hypothetical protein